MKAIILTLFALSLFTPSDEPKPTDAQKDAEKLPCTWAFTKMVRDGQDLTGQLGGGSVEFQKDKFCSPGIEAEFTLDPSKNPKAMDITYKQGPAAGQTVKAIYKIEGDKLTICRALAAADDRPKEFSAPAGSGRFLFEFERNKQ